ncbi:MAG: DMT family transporter [Verrucomicrobiales bacterium]|nr:DMT family transporter [Verrucomicrobiales bacterium]
MSGGGGRQWVWVLILVFAVVSMSTSIVFLRWSSLHPVQVSGWRMLGAAVVMGPLFLWEWRKHRGEMEVGKLVKCVWPGLFFGLHLVVWVVGARMTAAANAALAVNMVTAVLPLFLWLLVRERITGRELLGTVVALVGLGVMALGDVEIGGAYWRGDLVCFGAMVLLALYLTFGRKSGREFPGHWLYMVPVYAVAAVVCFGLHPVMGVAFVLPRGEEALWIVGLVVLPTVCGHGLVNMALRHWRGQVVGVFNQAQFVSAGVMGFFAFGEVPGWSFLVASVLVVTGAVVVARAHG